MEASAPSPASRLSRLEHAFLSPIDGAWLAALRFLFGVVLSVSMERFISHGWIEDLLVRPRFRFHYLGFGWVAPLSAGAMHVFFWIAAGLALAVAVGFAFRVTAPLFAAGLTYVQLIDVSTYLNHYYLAALLAWLLALSPAARQWSVDAWIGRRFFARPAAYPRVAWAWLALFRVQIGVVYVFAGLAKAQGDWLVHAQPLRIWLGASTGIPFLGRLLTIDGVPLAMSWFGFLFDTTIVLWLSFRRTRLVAFVVVLVFHAVTRILFDIGMFPFIMTVSALVFFSPSWPTVLLARLRSLLGRPPRREEDRGALQVGRALGHRVALGLGLVHCLVQIALPLRWHLYGGNVLWHEQGMRFSWRVMIRAKGGAINFLVREVETGRVFQVSPREYLTAFQENEMAGQPDLILELAHQIRNDFAARGFGRVQVRAESSVSLNGRRGAPLVDPDVDLGTVTDGVALASWISPAPDESPPHTMPVR